MKSILKQENGQLFLYRSEKRCPRNDDYSMYYGCQDPGEMLDRDWERWFSTAERIKVAEGEDEKFKREAYKWVLETNPDGLFPEELVNGIPIPDTCYKVRDYMTGGLRAYFKSPVVQEKGVKDNLASEGATNVFLGHSAYCSCLQCKPLTSKSSFNSRESTDTPSPQELKQHAIEFVKWIKKNEIDYSMTWEQIHDIFLSSK